LPQCERCMSYTAAIHSPPALMFAESESRDQIVGSLEIPYVGGQLNLMANLDGPLSGSIITSAG
jgi:hypothetical protein